MTTRTLLAVAGEAGAALTPADPTPAELGRRIKLLRVSLGLTLKDLEERGGVSATHVSEIERGKASPTVGALGRIALALGVRPAELLEPVVLPAAAVGRSAERALGRMTWDSAAVDPTTPPIQDARVGAYVVTLPIGPEPALTHRHEGEEWITVLSGSVEVQFENGAHLLREGDSLHFRGHLVHAYVNPSSIPTQILMVTRPRMTP